MVRYTEKLLEKGAERTRLTKQLAALVGAVAEDIVQSFPEGMAISPRKEPRFLAQDSKGNYLFDLLDLGIIEVDSNLGSKKFLGFWCNFAKKVHEEDDDDWQPTVFLSDKEPGSKFFLHGDIKAPVRVASQEYYIQFANHLPEIAAAFERKADEMNKELRAAFDKLKEMASTESGKPYLTRQPSVMAGPATIGGKLGFKK